MGAQILSLFQRAPQLSRDWSQQEIAEFYRVESALIQAGVQLESDRGLSDEGDPWFIFCRADTGDVFMHFARIDGVYVVDGAAFEHPARGPDFAALVRELIARYPLAKAREQRNSNVFVHPAALLIALVGAAFFHSNEAKAAELQDAKVEAPRRHSLLTNTVVATAPPVSGPVSPGDVGQAQAAAIILSAVLALHEQTVQISNSALSLLPAIDVWAEPTSLAPTLHILENFDQSAQLTIGAPPAVQVAVSEPSQVVVHLGQAPGVEIAIVAPSLAQEPPRPVAQLANPSPAPSAQGLVEAGDKPLFLVKSVAPAPWSTEAITLASSSLVLFEFLSKALPQVEKLPQALLQIINRGVQLEGATLLTSGSWLGLTPAAEEPGVDPTGSSAPVPTAPTNLDVHSPERNAAINAALAQFVSQVAHLEVIVEGNKLVLYDRDIFSPFAPDLNLGSVTFTFQDGSSVSLVGTTEDLGGYSFTF